MNCGLDEVKDTKALCPIAFASKNHSCAEQWYSNIEWAVLGKLHGLEIFKHYCFNKEVNVITNYKPLVAMVSKYYVTLSQWLQCIRMCNHQYSMHILNKPSAELYTVNWLSHHKHTESRNQEIAYMSICIHKLSTVIDILLWTLTEDISTAMSEDTELQMVQAYIIRG